MIKVLPDAASWFKREFDLEPGEGIRITAKGYGSTNKHEGISISIWQAQPEHIFLETTVDGILFFVEEVDEWLFNHDDLVIGYDHRLDEPIYEFTDFQKNIDLVTKKK